MIERIFAQEKIEYKKIDEENGTKLYKINSKCYLLYLKEKGNQFALNRDFFEYLDSNSLPYKILLHDVQKDKFYYLELRKNNNWIKSCFNTCNKDKIYLGKQVLNYPIDVTNLRLKLKKI